LGEGFVKDLVRRKEVVGYPRQSHIRRGESGWSGASSHRKCRVRNGDAGIPVLWDTAWILPLADQATVDAYLTARANEGYDLVMMNIDGWGMTNSVLGNGQTLFLPNGLTAPLRWEIQASRGFRRDVEAQDDLKTAV
jgi:hypothetical protein